MMIPSDVFWNNMGPAVDGVRIAYNVSCRQKLPIGKHYDLSERLLLI